MMSVHMDYIIQQAIRGAVNDALKGLPASVDGSYAVQSRSYLTFVINSATEQSDADALTDLGNALPEEVPERDDRLKALLAMYRDEHRPGGEDAARLSAAGARLRGGTLPGRRVAATVP